MVMGYNPQNLTATQRARRALVAYLTWHSSALAEHGITNAFLTSRASETAPQYDTMGITATRRQSSQPLRAQLRSNEENDIIYFDQEVIEEAFHMPIPSSNFVENIPDTITIECDSVGNDMTYNGYADLRAAYTDFALVLRTMPSVVIEICNTHWRTFLPIADTEYSTMANFETFTPPEVCISGGGNNLPKRSIAQIQNSNQYDGKLLEITGQVMEVGEVLKRPVRASFKCRHPDCGLDTVLMNDPFEETIIQPEACEHCSAGMSKEDPRPKWILNTSPKSTFVTQQKAFIQSRQITSSSPPEVLIEVRGTLCNTFDVGEEINICGIYREINVEKGANKSEKKPLFHVTSIVSTNRQIVVEVSDSERTTLMSWSSDMTLEQKWHACVADFHPNIHGNDWAKLAAILQSVGPNQNPHSTKRNWIHVMFIGDPGMGKTQLKDFACGLHPGSKRASGSRASIPGLIGGPSDNTAALGNSKRGMKPGILALTPQGAIAAIDELHSLGGDDRGRTVRALNDALESGYCESAMHFSGSVRTDTPVLVCLNPTGGGDSHFDMSPGAEPLVPNQAGVDPSFLSRMDIVIAFFDTISETHDRLVAEAMTRDRDNMTPDETTVFPIPNGLSKFLQTCRDLGHIPYSKEARRTTRRFYVEARKLSSDNTRLGPRWLDALMRLSEAMARLDHAEEITTEHTNAAKALIDESLTTKEPNITQEGGSGLLEENQKYYDTIAGIINDFLNYQDENEEWSAKDDAVQYVISNFASRAAEAGINPNDVPNAHTVENIMAHFKDRGDYIIAGNRIKDDR